MRRAWNHSHPDAVLEDLEVVITVPASFDEVARALTVTAARQTGLRKLTLVEEPQAAFYDFTSRHRQDLAAALAGVNLVLVVDVGGGTTDLTLVQVADEQKLRRIAVGEHLMLGGDNMDAAVARRAEGHMTAGGRKLSPKQWGELLQAGRAAKESLLSAAPPETHHLSVAGESGRLIGSALSARVTRAEVESMVLDGFFPHCTPDELPRRSTRVALQEFGLPYAQDPAITRQIAGFLSVHADAGRPDALLLNGGVFNSPAIAARLIEVIGSWWPGANKLRVLEHDSLELAVARGAAWYGLVRRGVGRRIGGGAAHSFYVGLDNKAGEEGRALCLVPRGQEEGQTIELGGRSFNLTLGKPVQFPLYTSTADRVTLPGDIVSVGEEMRALPPIHTILKSAENRTGQTPVHLRAVLTEIGTLELWCVSDMSSEQWRLEFELRGTTPSSTDTVIESMPPQFARARSEIEMTFGRQAASDESPKVKQLWKTLEQALGPREQWSLPVLREMWSTLHAAAAKRRRTAEHERLWFQLTGYTLRPGFGYPLDEWRCEQTAAIFNQGVNFHKEKPVWIEFWIMWRRIAAGLSETRQSELWTYLKPHLERRLAPSQPKNQPKLKGIQPEGLDEMVRLAAALEQLESSQKVLLGDWIASRVKAPGPWAWALGRIGARIPLYGSTHKVVEPEKAAAWLHLLLEAHGENVEGSLFAVVQIARLSGDRSRDLEEAIRLRALSAVRSSPMRSHWEPLLLEVIALETADKARAFGDTLPAGLAT
jgi:hypothetical protein